MLQKIVFIFTLFCCFYSNGQGTYKQSLKLMGCGFDITVVAKDSIKGKEYINLAVNEIVRIEKLISSWDKNSETSIVNSNAGIKKVKVSLELFQLIQRALKISAVTDGAFDISYASMDAIWKFNDTMNSMPSVQEIQNSVSKVGYQNIKLNKKDTTVFLIHKGMKIAFGAIGKGYAADKAKDIIQEKGCIAGIINASGDMTTWGKQTNGKQWHVAITNPLNKNKAFALLPLYNRAVVTSGNYENFVTFNGKLYSHIIDPRTGYPSAGIISVSVFAPKAELADALATAIFVMGKKVGIDRVNQLPNVECIIVEDTGEVSTSKNIKLNQL